MHVIGAQLVVMLKSTIKLVRNQTKKDRGSQIQTLCSVGFAIFYTLTYPAHCHPKEPPIIM